MTYKKKAKLLASLLPRKSFFINISGLASPHGLQKALATASDKEIDAMLRLLHACVGGLVPVPAALLRKIIKSKKLPLVKQLFEDEESFMSFLQNSSRHEKLAALSQIKSLLPVFSRVLL